LGFVDVVGLRKGFRIHSYRGGKFVLKAVHDVSFEIEPGETFGLVGESGSGKSTIARMIVGLLTPDAGRIMVGGRGPEGLGKKERGLFQQQLSIVFQNPFSSLDPKMNVFRIISEPLRAFHLYSENELRERVAVLLDKVGLSADQHMHQYPHEFSGGQRQRIAIARAISFNPKLLVLDEPTSALDVSVQAKIINLLTKLQKENNLTYLFISHNIGAVRHISTRIGVMYRGRLLETCDTNTMIEKPAHPYSRYLISSIPRMTRKVESTEGMDRIIAEQNGGQSTGCPFFGKCSKRMERCLTIFPDATLLDKNHVVYCHLYNI
jgi:oligopeptide/dipeptide ABC transporter ATP-binding protein